MPEFVTRHEAAEIAGVSVSTIQSHRFPGDRTTRRPFPEPAARYGQVPVWQRADVERWAKAARRKGATMKRSDMDEAAVIAAAARHHWPIHDAFPDVPAKIVYAKVAQLVARGQLEYGTSIRCPWPTVRVEGGRTR